MTENQDNIEARLCAYIDGELSAAEQAQIERYLAANPQQKRMLDAMKAQRQVLRDLPRETAPTDISEAIEAQLERSALLGGGSDVILKIRRWPQILAAAAVLLLTVGLVSVVVMVVTPTHVPTVAMGPATVRPKVADRIASKTSAHEMKETDTDVPPVDGTPEDVLPAPAVTDTPLLAVRPDSRHAGKGGAGKGGAAQELARVPQEEWPKEEEGAEVDLDKVEDQLASTGNLPQNEAKLVVLNTQDTQLTNGQVTTYLARNNFSYQAVPAPTGAPIAAAKPGMKFGNEGYQSTLPSAPRTMANAPPASADRDALEKHLQDKLQTQRPEGIAQKQEQRPSMPAPQQAVDQRQQLARANRIDNMIVVRGVTRRQADELCSSLSLQQAGQRAHVLEYSQRSRAQQSNQMSQVQEPSPTLDKKQDIASATTQQSFPGQGAGQRREWVVQRPVETNQQAAPGSGFRTTPVVVVPPPATTQSAPATSQVVQGQIQQVPDDFMDVVIVVQDESPVPANVKASQTMPDAAKAKE